MLRGHAARGDELAPLVTDPDCAEDSTHAWRCRASDWKDSRHLRVGLGQAASRLLQLTGRLSERAGHFR